MLVTEYLKKWLETEEIILKRSTYEAYTVYVNKHIKPFFEEKEIEIKEVKPIIIQEYVNKKLKSGRLDGKEGGLSIVSVKKHISVMKQAFKDAVLYGEIENNPVDSIKIPRRKAVYSKRCIFLEAKEAQKMIKDIEENRKIQTAVIITLYYGLRRSEVLGIKRKAIDLKNDTMKICYTVVKNLTIQESEIMKNENSEAIYELLPDVKEALIKIGINEMQPEEFIISGKNGGIMRPDSLTRSFQRILKRKGYPKMRFHDLRHSTASVLFARGWSIEDVKRWLRHTDIETTSNIYIHYLNHQKITPKEDINGIFNIG